jgi:hypothetical protein
MSADSTSWSVDTSGVTADSGDYTADGSGYIQFPNVPNLPGVPPLNRIAPGVQQLVDAVTGAAVQQPATLPGMALGNFSPGPLPQYAILYPPVNSSGNALSGLAAITPDSFVEIDVQADSEIMTHPIEQGEFDAYNRVQDPIAIRLLLCCQGENMGHAAFLSALEGLREGTDLLTIATPDAAYPNMALKGYGYKKTAEEGAVTIWADTAWGEGRSTGVTVSPPPTSQPQGAATTPLGGVQLQPLTPSQLASVGNPSVPPAPLPESITNEAPSSGDAF